MSFADPKNTVGVNVWKLDIKRQRCSTGTYQKISKWAEEFNKKPYCIDKYEEES